MSFPLISIIVPVFNSESYLDKCVQSIIKQTYPSLEIILINDGSTDNSLNICLSLQKKYSHILVFSQENLGQASARNFGIKKASGSFIGFVDSDDWIDENMYMTLFQSLVTNNADISCCSIVKTKGSSMENVFYHGSPLLFDTNDAIKELLNNYVVTCSPCDKLYKAEIVKNQLMNEGKVFEDLEVMPKWVSKAKLITHCGESLYFYRFNNQGTIADVTVKCFDEVWANESRLSFIRENYPRLLDLASIKDLEARFNVLSKTRGIKQFNEKRFELKQSILERRKTIKRQLLPRYLKFKLFVIRTLGLRGFDFFSSIHKTT